MLRKSCSNTWDVTRSVTSAALMLSQPVIAMLGPLRKPDLDLRDEWERLQKLEDTINVDRRCSFSSNIQQFLVSFQEFKSLSWQDGKQNHSHRIYEWLILCFCSSSVMFHLKHKNAECDLRVKKGWEWYLGSVLQCSHHSLPPDSVYSVTAPTFCLHSCKRNTVQLSHRWRLSLQ